MSIFFDFIYLVLSFFYLPAFIFKGKHRLGFKERLGFYSVGVKRFFQAGKPLIWLHGVSVGEIKAAAALLKKLHEYYPQYRILLSTITPTGNIIARNLITDRDLAIYFPFDLSFIAKRVLELIKPKLILIMETELWPNIISLARARNIPVAIINGRISNRAFPRYRLGRIFFRKILSSINLFCMQTERNAQRIKALGAANQRVYVTGNIKFEQIKKGSNIKIPALNLERDDRLIVAGSTHEKEEEIIIRQFRRLKAIHPQLRLLIAPRHPHRTKDIDQILRKNDLKYTLISQLSDGQVPQFQDAIFILDTMGMLDQIYSLADIVFIGGSLVPHGGHNPIEPAVYGKPIIFGKYMFNFAEIAKIFIQQKAAICVSDEQQLYDRLKFLLNNDAERQNLAANAQRLILENQGSIDRVLGLLAKVMVSDTKK